MNDEMILIDWYLIDQFYCYMYETSTERWIYTELDGMFNGWYVGCRSRPGVRIIGKPLLPYAVVRYYKMFNQFYSKTLWDLIKNHLDYKISREGFTLWDLDLRVTFIEVCEEDELTFIE